MQKYTIIWDFDGTILPLEPYDSEQSLIVHKLNHSGVDIPFFKRLAARAAVYADMRGWFPKSFTKIYLSLLQGTGTETLDQVSGLLAEKISEADRQAIQRLKKDGHDMMVISCGTADLSERVLKAAGLGDCFYLVEGNRFRIENDRIAGMDFHVSTPEHKLRMVKAQRLHPEKSIVIGDGCTDLPLLDWAGMPVLIDRTGEKTARYNGKGYYFISAIPEVVEMIERDFIQIRDRM